MWAHAECTIIQSSSRSAIKRKPGLARQSQVRASAAAHLLEPYKQARRMQRRALVHTGCLYTWSQLISISSHLSVPYTSLPLSVFFCFVVSASPRVVTLVEIKGNRWHSITIATFGCVILPDLGVLLLRFRRLYINALNTD